MTSMRFRTLAGFLLASFLCGSLQASDVTDEISEAASGFIESLGPELRDKAIFELKSEERYNWNFVPMDRKGVSFKDLTKKQKDAAHALLDSVLSQRGFVNATTIISLETILHDLENKSPRRDPSLYYISIFGSPTNSHWGWRFEGHHLSMNFAVADDSVSVTPTFWGSNPGEVKDGPRKGLRTLGAEEDLGRQMVKALDDDQKKVAIFADKAPKEILTGNQRSAKPLQPDGIAFAEMNREQGQLLLKLVKHYLERYRPEIAESAWKKIQAANLEQIHFAWAGSVEPGQGHYYRVQGPTFLLEYDNTQNNANHVHTAWRDFTGDFGDDLLAAHIRAEHSQPSPTASAPAAKP